MLLLNVFTLNKNNERLTRELSSPTEDLVNPDKAPGDVKSLLALLLDPGFTHIAGIT